MDSSRNSLPSNTDDMATKFTGRNKGLNLVRVSCGRAITGRSTWSIIFLGLKGTEKSRLLDEIGQVTHEVGLLISNVKVVKTLVFHDFSIQKCLVSYIRYQPKSWLCRPLFAD